LFRSSCEGGTGETIFSIQQRVEDAGFTDVMVIPMGGDNVFLHCRNHGDMMLLIILA